MAKSSVDARLKLGEPLATTLRDFCSANYSCPQIEVIREALQNHIEGRLAREPELRKRFDEARTNRLSLHKNVTPLPSARK